jgi:uncharacterized protein (DUF488 family)
MYYRRKILLSLLQVFDNKLEKLRLQKLLFLYNRLQSDKSFHFVPYKYGCFSFQANADMKTMIKYNMVSVENKTWVKTDNVDYVAQLKQKDLQALKNLVNLHGHKTPHELIQFTYTNFPFFATKSVIAKDCLTEAEFSKITKAIPVKTETKLYTIGYEGISLEEYLNKLLAYDIKVLCDVRKNSSSMKYGFSKSQLRHACENLDIKFIHIPDLGIESECRQELNTQADYDKLFTHYRKTTLQETSKQQQELIELVNTYSRVAITCFEANIHQCHRKHLAEAVQSNPKFKFEIKHI